ncbi:2-aminoadipate transaminase [compost metagenome]
MILFTNGAQNAITAILAGLFKAGDRIGTDPMTYPGIKTAANMLGIQLVPIKQKDYEITEEGLMYACKNENIKCLYMVPDFQNPTTHTMSVSTRKMIGEIAIKENLIVIEDAIHSLLTERPLAPIASYAPDQVLYISSLSKVISPGLRFGYIAAPEPFKRKLAIALYNFNISVAPLMTELVTQMINTGVTDKILDNHRSFTKEQNSIVDQWLGDYQIVGSAASIFRWLLLPDYFTGESFELRAYQAGVQVYAADRFAVGTAQPQNAVRIAVTAPGNDGGLEQGLRIIKALLESNEEIPSLY